MSRQSLDADPGSAEARLRLYRPAEWMPQLAIRHALRQIAASQEAEASLITAARTDPPALRRLLTRRLASNRASTPHPSRSCSRGSGTQAIDLLCRYLLWPGDDVLVDDPCYFNFRALLRAHRARVHSVPLTPTGPEPGASRGGLAAERPRLYLTNSAIHDLRGVTLSPADAVPPCWMGPRAHDVAIVEDDSSGTSSRTPRRDWRRSMASRASSDRQFLEDAVGIARAAATSPPGATGSRILIDLQVATGFGGPSPVRPT